MLFLHIILSIVVPSLFLQTHHITQLVPHVHPPPFLSGLLKVQSLTQVSVLIFAVTPQTNSNFICSSSYNLFILFFCETHPCCFLDIFLADSAVLHAALIQGMTQHCTDCHILDSLVTVVKTQDVKIVNQSI